MKVDLKKQITAYSAPRGEFAVVDVPPLQYLMVDGHGDPNTSPAYREAVTSIYPVAYTLKSASKRELDRDYTVTPLEALWWAEDMSAFTTARDKSSWNWTLLLLVPDWLGSDDVERARSAVARSRAPALDRIRLERLDEGRCVQTLHVGPYDDEGPALRAMHHDAIPALGLRMTGRHHEIYLSDARRTDPARLRTLLRQPVTDAEP
ncbi:GyrI-like domain-containing protein [Blastococcus goldschmidtiae]|uniref:GyrI-like domain-containing protein n=1 Tax=Blastococcus goldschmidtiae TaxID=3075546 RepID=A0ABU2K7Q2_9ACTN|nr:GyrI-like domain-containing protein [Blastococcus sp. DSM 46792]MDT0276218.1 GyrI-like domain-containing protein [Blastococcus sp. DSM 46792]